MTKEMLLKLNKYLREGIISIQDITTWLKELSDEEIEIILNCNNQIEIKKLIQNENFKKLSKETKKAIIIIIDKPYNDSKSYAINNVAVEVATNEIVINSGNVVELTTAIRNSVGYNQAISASLIACNPYIKNNHILKLVTMISQCKKQKNEQEFMNLITTSATNNFIIRSENIVKIISSLIEAKDIYEATMIYNEVIKKLSQITLLSSLHKGNIEEINFWDLFADEPKKALEILEQITSTNSKNSPYEAINLESLNEQVRPKLTLNNPEIKPNMKIRLKK